MGAKIANLMKILINNYPISIYYWAILSIYILIFMVVLPFDLKINESKRNNFGYMFVLCIFITGVFNQSNSGR